MEKKEPLASKGALACVFSACGWLPGGARSTITRVRVALGKTRAARRVARDLAPVRGGS